MPTLPQELEKAHKPSETAETVHAYNDVCTQVMRVSKGVALDFKNAKKSEFQQQFSYNKRLKHMQPAKSQKAIKPLLKYPQLK